MLSARAHPFGGFLLAKGVATLPQTEVDRRFSQNDYPSSRSGNNGLTSIRDVAQTSRMRKQRSFADGVAHGSKDPRRSIIRIRLGLASCCLACCVWMESSLRGAQRRSNPENVRALRSPGLLRFARNDAAGSTQMQLAL